MTQSLNTTQNKTNDKELIMTQITKQKRPAEQQYDNLIVLQEELTDIAWNVGIVAAICMEENGYKDTSEFNKLMDRLQKAKEMLDLYA